MIKILSIRTQDKMALVPYKSIIEVIVLDDYGKETNKEITALEIERGRISIYSKGLPKPKHVYLEEIDKKILELKNKGNKTAILEEKDSGYTLGTYATKKRALEVLDEIENALYDCNYVVLGSDTRGITYPQFHVYQMPKE